MFVKRAMPALLALALISGCGGPMEESASPETVDSLEQPIIWPCDGSRSWVRTWYYNGVESGYETCHCDGSVFQYGTVYGSYTQQATGSCTY